MSWTEQQLAEALARNPDIRLAPGSRLSRKSVVAAPPAKPELGRRQTEQELEAPAQQPVGLNGRGKKRKYRNIPIVLDGVKFDSGKEARRWQELQLLEKAGEISDLRRQVKFEFNHNGVRIGSFKPDFTYLEKEQLIVEDTKSPATRRETSYRLRTRLLKAFFGLDVRET